MALSNGSGKVKSKRIGQSNATKHPERMDAQRL